MLNSATPPAKIAQMAKAAAVQRCGTVTGDIHAARRRVRELSGGAALSVSIAIGYHPPDEF